jgi:ABC-type transporter Mla maintaining outer membrane lipid asymmetry ATPase subunit MlaF
VTITHDMVAFKIADRVAMLYKGHHRAKALRRSSGVERPIPSLRQFIEGRAEGPLTDSGMRTSRSSAGSGAHAELGATREAFWKREQA